MHNKDYAAKVLLPLMTFCLFIVMCGACLQGCEFDTVHSDIVVSNDQFSYNVKSFDPFRDSNLHYFIDKNTNIVYILYYNGSIESITAAFNKDGTVMKLEDLTKLLEDK